MPSITEPRNYVALNDGNAAGVVGGHAAALYWPVISMHHTLDDGQTLHTRCDRETLCWNCLTLRQQLEF